MKNIHDNEIIINILNKLDSLSSIESSFYNHNEVVKTFETLLDKLENISDETEEIIYQNNQNVEQIEKQHTELIERIKEKQENIVFELTNEYKRQLKELEDIKNQKIKDSDFKCYKDTFNIKKHVKELQEQKQICGETHLENLRKIESEFKKNINEIDLESNSNYDEITSEIEKFQSQISIINDTKIIEQTNIDAGLDNLKITIDERIQKIQNEYNQKISEIKKDISLRMSNLNDRINQNIQIKAKKIMDNDRQLDLEITQYNLQTEKVLEQYEKDKNKILDDFQELIIKIDNEISALRSKLSDLESSYTSEIKKLNIFKDRKKKKELDSFFTKNSKRIKNDINKYRSDRSKEEIIKNNKLATLETNKEADLAIINLKIENANNTKLILRQIEDINDDKRSEDLRFGYETHKESSYCDEKTLKLNFDQSKENILYQYTKKEIDTNHDKYTSEIKHEMLLFNVNETIKMLEVKCLLEQNQCSLKKQFETIKYNHGVEIEEINFKFKTENIDLEIESMNIEIEYLHDLFMLEKEHFENIYQIESDDLNKTLKYQVALKKIEKNRFINEESIKLYNSHYNQDVNNIKQILTLSAYYKEDNLEFVNYFIKRVEMLGIMTFEANKTNIKAVLELLISFYKYCNAKFFNYINQVISSRLRFERDAKYSKVFEELDSDIDSLNLSLDYKLKQIDSKNQNKLSELSKLKDELDELERKLIKKENSLEEILNEEVYQINDRQIRISRTKEEIKTLKNTIKDLENKIASYDNIFYRFKNEKDSYKALFAVKLNKIQQRKESVTKKMNGDFKGYTNIINQVNAIENKISKEITSNVIMSRFESQYLKEIYEKIKKMYEKSYALLIDNNQIIYQMFDEMVQTEINNVNEINEDAYQKGIISANETNDENREAKKDSINSENVRFTQEKDFLLSRKNDDIRKIKEKKTNVKETKKHNIEGIAKQISKNQDNFNSQIVLSEINISEADKEFRQRIEGNDKEYSKKVSFGENKHSIDLNNLDKYLEKKEKDLDKERNNYQELKRQNSNEISLRYHEYLKNEKQSLKDLAKKLKTNVSTLADKILLEERKKKEI